MEHKTIKELEQEVWEYCEKISDNPQARFESRCAFYKKYGYGSDGTFGYGDSELAFMKWELKSRLSKTGSRWWEAVNLRFIYHSELGARAYENQIPANQMPIPSSLWARYIAEPSSVSWYRAHNGSILDGYEEYKNLAILEPYTEQSFVNIVLYRLLYAQSMVEGWSVAETLGKILADPKGDAVSIITQMSDFYPPNYPMTMQQYNAMFGKVHNLEEFSEQFFDDVVIGTEFLALYRRASSEDHAPYLTSFLTNQKPAYPSGVPVYMGKIFWLTRILRIIWKWLFGIFKCK